MYETRAIAIGAFILGALPATAAAHAELYPHDLESGHEGYVALVVPTERDDAKTTEIEITVPDGVELSSFEAIPGWTREITRTGDAITRVVWTGEAAGTDEAAVFRFAVGGPDGDYTLPVKQTYDDGQVVQWNGPADADEPAPTLSVGGDHAGGGHSDSTLPIIAIVLSALALIASLVVPRLRGRPLS